MNTLFLDALSNFEKLPVFGENNFNSLDIINSVEWINENFDRIIVLQNGNIDKIPDRFKNVIVSDMSVNNVLSTMIKEVKNSDHVMVMNATNPFLDKNFIHNMFSRHKDFMADYTYSIGYPDGLLPTILSVSCLKQLQEISKNVEIDVGECKDYLFQLLSKDINSFDVETFISPVDLRIKRCSVGNSDAGELIFTSALVEKLGLNASFDDLVLFISQNSQYLFSTIYSLFIDITNNEATSATYLPKNTSTVDFMDLGTIQKIAQEFSEINSKIKVIIGNKCEPMIHPDFVNVVNVFAEKGFNVIIETFANVLPENLSEISEFDNVTFVFKIDAQNENTYRMIHPNGDYKTAINNYEKVKELGFKAYFQIVRTVETENDIEVLIKNKQSNLLIKKYSSYCNVLADKKVVDLSPLERFECYHLRRDMYLDSAADVYYCIYSDKKIGNAKLEKITELINKQKNAFISHAQGQMSDFCKLCDDYYTFNF
ncbi:MAG: spiro-SPASM protein [Spirochaetota bacterium]|nr:spiro-SPASM protein [Spirochaetota bacterium]